MLSVRLTLGLICSGYATRSCDSSFERPSAGGYARVRNKVWVHGVQRRVSPSDKNSQNNRFFLSVQKYLQTFLFIFVYVICIHNALIILEIGGNPIGLRGSN